MAKHSVGTQCTKRSGQQDHVKGKLNNVVEGKCRHTLVSFPTMEKKSSNPKEESSACGKECSITVHLARDVDCFRCEPQFISVSVPCSQDNCLKHSGEKQTTWPPECAIGEKKAAMKMNKQITIINHQSLRPISSEGNTLRHCKEIELSQTCRDKESALTLLKSNCVGRIAPGKW